jgi:Tol biopolymer transport system component
MALSAGTRFGSFEIVSPLGAGGMGEVYRARDTRLNRGVALKVLPELVSFDPDRISRFKREAQLLAALSHPGIASIHGIEEADGVHALVLELVEGPTLAERIERGAIPLEEALPIARQIAEALEAAHEIGIIHRDLKPANIKVTDEGVVKVLDFGLAKALDGDQTKSAVDVSQSPTLTAATAMGVILGTAAYMAPEQARGKTVDRRADIWAFGCVLYEMLTARRAFEGDSVTDTMAAILRGEPDWTALPAFTPRVIRRLLQRCLAKDRRDRLQAIGDARLEIKEAMTAGDEVVAAAAVAPQLSSSRRLLPLVAAAAAAAVLAGAAVWMLKPTAPVAQPRVTRSLLGLHPFDRRPGAGTFGETRRPDRTAIALSPDGRTLVIRAATREGQQLFVRPLDQLDATPLAGTEQAENPFFSSDGAWVAFRRGGELKKVAIGGGVASTITRVPGLGGAPPISGATWEGNTIVFATAEGIWQVDARGGESQQLTAPSGNEYRRTLPHLLPGGRALLYTRTLTAYRWNNAQIVVRVLDTGAEKVLIENGADARYASSGHVVFLRAGMLMAAPFDVATLELTGSPIELVNGVMQAVNTGNRADDSGAGQVAMAADGTLVYATGGPVPPFMGELVWIDRTGKVEAIELPDRPYATPRIAPDGRRIAVSIGPDSERKVWVHDLQRGGLSAVTSADDFAFFNIWSPDGQRLTFAAETRHIGLRSADGAGVAERLHTSETDAAPSSWSTDGRLLAFVEGHPETAADIWIQDLSDPKQPRRPFLQTAANETYPEFSPDGRWLAYTSNQSGTEEVYVQPYPGPGPRVQVSTNGGRSPAWGRGGAEIYYWQSAMMAVLVENWFEELKQRVPAK